MPVYVVVGKGAFTDRVSTVFFPRDFKKLLGVVAEKFGSSFPTLEKLFDGVEVDGRELLEEAVSLLQLLKSKAAELPRAYFFAVMPKDFEDVASLIGGGASSITVPTGEGVYRLIGGFGGAELRSDKGKRALKAGEELSLGAVKVKVFTRLAYEAVSGPLKTLITASLIASRRGEKLRVVSSLAAAGVVV